MKKVIIIGGGISGLFSAYYLTKLNYQVTIIDNANFINGCSHGNAGLVVPSHIIPLAAPGVIPKALKWMFNTRSPFSFHPKLNKDFISWCLHFLKNSSESNVKSSIIPLRDISLLSSSLYIEVSQEFKNSFSLSSKGLLMLYKNAKIAEEEYHLSKLAESYGIKTNILSNDEINSLDPSCKYDVLGGIHYLGDSHLNPNLLLRDLIEHLKTEKVEFVSGENITDITLVGKNVNSVKCNSQEIDGDSFLFCSGVWTSSLLKKIDLNIPLMPGKGYSFNTENKNDFPTIPSILVDARVAVTPMDNNLRIAGTMEIDTINSKIRINRVKGMINSFNKYYPDLNINMPSKNNIWYGLRPCSPDGLPYLGKSTNYNNLFIATGHAMLGLSLGPATGKLISEVISETKTSIDISSFQPERYNR
jgi:D-amino-acid dehydrogenase